MKKCSSCKENKNLSSFSKKTSCKDGLNIFCRSCHSIRNVNWQKANKEKRKAICARFYKKHKTFILPKHLAYNASRKEEIKKYSAKRYMEKRMEITERNRAWAIANPGLVVAKTRRYQARRTRACPRWVDQSKIDEFYILAKSIQWLSEEPLEVDHIVPLQGKNVCGLHVPWNLQIIPRSKNRKKAASLGPGHD